MRRTRHLNSTLLSVGCFSSFQAAENKSSGLGLDHGSTSLVLILDKFPTSLLLIFNFKTGITVFRVFVRFPVLLTASTIACFISIVTTVITPLLSQAITHIASLYLELGALHSCSVEVLQLLISTFPNFKTMSLSELEFQNLFSEFLKKACVLDFFLRDICWAQRLGISNFLCPLIILQLACLIQRK